MNARQEPSQRTAHGMAKERACTPAQLQYIQSCQGLVRAMAWRIQRKRPPWVELDDLIAYGQVGLCEAARDYDPAWGARFITYAHYRIRGAIFDGLSRMSWFSRFQYHRSRYEQLADDVLRLEDSDSGVEASRPLEHDLGALARTAPALAMVYLAVGCDPEDDGGCAVPADASARSPHAMAVDRETRETLQLLIDALPADAGALMRGVYYEGLTLQQAGERVGISKAWASRLHAKTLRRLAHALRLMGHAD